LLPALSENFTTLAELFSDNGYRTAAVVANHGYVNSHFKLDQGFDFFDSRSSIGRVYFSFSFRPLLHFISYLTNIFPEFILPYRNAQTINDLAMPVLDQLSKTPFFMFLNYNDAHEPYAAHLPFGIDMLKMRFPRINTADNYSLTHFSAQLEKRNLYPYLQFEYDKEIAFLDSRLGDLFSRLKKMGIYDQSLIIITSDHGQLLGKPKGSRFLFNHAANLYQGAVKVPLIIKFPFSKTVGRDKKLLILSELYYKIITTCNLTVPEDIQKKMLAKTSLPVVAEIYGNNVGIKHLALYDGDYKYMTYERWMEHELYDLGSDPNEEINIAGKLPDVAERMAEKLESWKQTHNLIIPTENKSVAPLSQESLMDLKALGYIE
jgi:arylsulfatase A-like enzyme